MRPIVSILIPAYNAEPWIADTINSALGQTWPRKEIIVVDDGSTDQTLCIARRFASKDVSVVTQENQGAAAARNKAFELCQGDYIQWLDAGDLLSLDKIDKQMKAAREHSQDTLISSGWGYFIYRPDKARFIPTPLWCDLTPLEWLLRKFEHPNLHMQTATWLVGRELTEGAGTWDTRLLNNDDGEYFCRVPKKLQRGALRGGCQSILSSNRFQPIELRWPFQEETRSSFPRRSTTNGGSSITGG